MKYSFDTEFELGQRVFYRLPDSPAGIVTGIGYNVSSDTVTYYVTFDPLSGETACLSWELSTNSTVI